MGLDMYLRRRHYIGAEYKHRGVKGTIDITIGNKRIPINFNRVSYIEEEVCYWRKANQIHNWFVENVQNGEDNCRSYYVDIEQLEELLNLCKQVKEKAIIKKGKIANGYTFEEGKKVPILEDGEYIENSDEIEEILPTSSGFFFGSTAYDQWYMQDINSTIKQLETVVQEEKELNELGFYSDYEYRASW